MLIICAILLVLFFVYLGLCSTEDTDYYGTPATRKPVYRPPPPPKRPERPRFTKEAVQTQSKAKQEAVSAVQDEEKS